MAIRLRQACVTDIPAIYRGEESYIRCWEPEHEITWRLQLERHLTRWVDNFERLKIALVDDHFAGYSLWMPDQNYAELTTLHVVTDHRRSGVAMALLEAYALDAAGQGFTQLRLSVRPDNPAMFLYQKAGFRCTGKGAHDYLTYERHAWLMPR
ncbi:GCN5-related N-acetyltransferase [Paucimonas lemoignei]|jgi:ribosomal-protein-alanine N-acetyltransferase|nr:GCN5-related N-acetyltransferase [Paucimonas lemoignei]